MKRIHILLMALVALSIQGCQDDFNVPSEQASRSYEQDAEVLNRFVDINKTTHEYYINPNKRTTALSYITNDGAEELAINCIISIRFYFPLIIFTFVSISSKMMALCSETRASA